MRMPVRPVILTIPLVLAAAAAAAGEPAPLGFFPASTDAQRRVEEVFLATPAPDRAREWLRTLTEEPHVAGTDGGRRVAEFVRDRFREFGFEAELVEYHVLLNYPGKVTLEMLEPEALTLSLFEEGYRGDKDSFSHDVFPGFHGYGAGGVAEGQVVYANYGRVEDFRKLESMKIDVRDRIVLVRYGKIFRGLKVREAQERGAAGIIIYSDPADDGYMKGDIYPDGPMRPPSAIQRGSVQFLSEGPGDPGTPGFASTAGAKRIPREEIERFARIPSLPLGYGEAEKILRAIAGARVPDEWQGGLPFAYHVGPGPAKVRMEVEQDYAVRPIWNVVGKLRGAEERERWVVVGNHHDAWTYGAVDPSSGTAALLEAARGISAAVRAGWKPRRTVLLCAWDAEEYGLVGSTEWGENLARELGEKTVAYLNLDSATTGIELGASGIPSLTPLFLEVTARLDDPLREETVGALWRKSRREKWVQEEPVVLDGPDAEFFPRLDPLGSGSDYTVFVDHLGIASLNFSFQGSYGVYHSILDDFFWMDRFGDPQFHYHAAAAKLLGLLTMRLAAADAVPLRYVPYAETLRHQLDDLRRTAARERRKIPQEGEAPAPSADFGPVLEALTTFGRAAGDLDAALDALPNCPPEGKTLAAINDAVVGIERAFLSERGLPGRPWFRHVLYAPGLTTGYASWPFPGLTQAVLDRDATLWDAELARLLERLEAATAALEGASRRTPRCPSS